MDVGRSFTFVTKDPDWVKKVLVGGVIVLLGSIVFPIAFILTGYQLAIVRRVYDGADVPLPEWDDIGGYFVRGLLASVGLIIWTLPLVVLFGCVLAGASVASNNAGSAVALLAVCLGIPVGIVYFAFIYPVVFGRYAIHNTFGSMFEFGEIMAEIRRAPGALLLTALIAFLAVFLAYFGLIACIIGVFFTITYAYFVMAHVLGQAYRQASGAGQQLQSTAAF